MITISKPIDEVVKYVMDAKNWTEWGLRLIKAENVESNIIEATYRLGLFNPPLDIVIRWLVSHNFSSEFQIVIFTNIADRSQTVEYIFASREQGASTDVTRNEAKLQGDTSEDISRELLPNLQKKSIEGAPTIPSQ